MLRKFLVILVSMLMLCSVCLAEVDIDVSSLTIEELLELRKMVSTELNMRLQVTDDVFYPYDYIVGEHIPAGGYLVTCVEVTGDYDYGTIAAWAEGESNWNCYVVEYPEAGDTYCIILEEGDTLRLNDGLYILQPYVLPSL